jgi:magnesium transporter
VAAIGITTWTRTGQRWQPGGEAIGHDVVWVRTADQADFVEVGAEHGLPQHVLEHAGQHTGPGARLRPHLELLEGGGVHLVAPTLTYRGADDVITGEVACLVLGGVVLTAETGGARILDRVADRLNQPQVFVDQLTGGVLSALLKSLVESAADVEAALADALEDVEGVVFSTSEVTPVERVYELKREIAEARRGLVPLGAELPDLLTDPDSRAAADAWVHQLETAVDRLDRRLEDHDQLLADMLSAHLALVSVRQNETIRRISAWAAIAAVPTLIASIYGMNFAHMPELAWTWGYAGAIALMAGLSVLLHRLFRRSGWL